MSLKTQDLLVTLAVLRLSQAQRSWTYSELAQSLILSVGEAHAAYGRAIAAGLIREFGTTRPKPDRKRLLDFLLFGVPVVFYPKRTLESCHGVFTGIEAMTLFETKTEKKLVWPDRYGTSIGEGIEPLYPSVPTLAMQDAWWHEMMAAIDVVRTGERMERSLASDWLAKKILLKEDR